MSSGKVTLAGMAQCARGVGISRMSTCLCDAVIVVVVVAMLLLLLPEKSIPRGGQANNESNTGERGMPSSRVSKSVPVARAAL